MRSKTKKLVWIVAGLTVLSLGALLWHSETKPEPPKAAHDEISPAATPSVEKNIASPNSPAGQSRVTSGEIPLQVDRHAANGEFSYPFLGSVKAYVHPEIVRFHARSGALVEFPVKVFYSEKGNFIRAEFVKPDAGDFQTPVEEVETALRMSEEAVIGFPKKTFPVSLETLLEQLQMPFEKVTRFNVTYVDYKFYEKPVAPTILVNVFGLESIVSARSDGSEGTRRIRIVLDQNGDVTREDNFL